MSFALQIRLQSRFRKTILPVRGYFLFNTLFNNLFNFLLSNSCCNSIDSRRILTTDFDQIESPVENHGCGEYEIMPLKKFGGVVNIYGGVLLVEFMLMRKVMGWRVEVRQRGRPAHGGYSEVDEGDRRRRLAKKGTGKVSGKGNFCPTGKLVW